jgi:hypothetical protein
VGARSARLFTGGLMLAAVGLASACAGQPVMSAPAAVSAPSAPSTLSALSASVGAHMASAADFDGKPVNCGKVGPTGGKQVDLIAEAAPAGTVGCTEAIDVITQYYKAAEAPVAGDGTARIRKVGKWTCLVDTGVPIKERYIVCGSTDGLALHTQP